MGIRSLRSFSFGFLSPNSLESPYNFHKGVMTCALRLHVSTLLIKLQGGWSSPNGVYM